MTMTKNQLHQKRRSKKIKRKAIRQTKAHLYETYGGTVGARVYALKRSGEPIPVELQAAMIFEKKRNEAKPSFKPAPGTTGDIHRARRAERLKAQ